MGKLDAGLVIARWNWRWASVVVLGDEGTLMDEVKVLVVMGVEVVGE